MSTSEPKDIHWKGQSRIDKACHWCTKKEQPGAARFQACSKCKEVIYCSRECQAASWPLHKGPCKVSAEAKQHAAASPALNQAVANFKKWHGSHVNELRHAVVCALNLGRIPSNADDHTVLVKVQLKFNHKNLSADKKYEPVGGFDLTMKETRDILKRNGGEAILDSAQAAHEHMKKKGGLGVAILLMRADDIVDVVKIVLPSVATAKQMQNMDDWGDHWVSRLRLAVG